MTNHVLAIDLGASALRAALVDAQGGLHDLAASPHITGDEADPEAWWTALQGLATERWAGAAAVCITGFTRTQILLGPGGAVVRPAITFRDTRAAGFGPDPFHPAARLDWLARHEPASLAAAAAVVEPKDFLAARLTARVCTDAICGERLAARRPATERLPPLSLIGRVQPLAGALGGLAGRPVVMAAHDSWASVIGLGALRPGGAYVLSGSTGVLGVLSRARAGAPGLLTDAWGGLFHVGGPSNAGGDSLAWVLGLLAPGEPPGPALDRLLRLPRQPRRALFVPYLDGERTPHWDAGLRGAFAGLGRAHGPADLAWAVLEGVACHAREVLDRAEAACGVVAGLRYGGGGAASPAWRQVMADVLRRPVVTTSEPECGLLGAGIAAWTALGAFADLAAAQNAMVRPAARHEPGRDTADLVRLFRAACEALAPLSRALAGA